MIGVKVSLKFFYNLFIRLFDYQSLCPSVRLSIRPSVGASVHPFICPSVRPFTHLSICLSFFLSVCLSIHMSYCPSVCLSFFLSVCPSVCLSFFLSFRPSVHPSVCPSICASVFPPRECKKWYCPYCTLINFQQRKLGSPSNRLSKKIIFVSLAVMGLEDLEKNRPNLGKSSQNNCQTKKAKVFSSKLN
jgi:hypothetical protein